MAHGEALDVDLVQHRVRVPAPGPVAVLPAERRVHDQAPGHVPGGVQACSARRGRRRPGRAPRARTRPCRPPPWRRGRAAAWPGCTAGPGPGPTGRRRGTRRTAPGRRPARTRARCRRRFPAAGSGFRCLPHRTGTSVTPLATLEASAKFVPAMPRCSPGVAPSGNGRPGSAWAAHGGGRPGPPPPRWLGYWSWLGLCWPGRAGRLRRPGPRRGGAGSGRRPGRSIRSGGRRRSRRRCRRGSTR